MRVFKLLLKWGRKKQDASYTVEGALVYPLVILCIFLLLGLNFYFHDLVLMQSIAQEIVASDMETAADYKKSAEEMAKEWSYLPGKTVFSYNQTLLSRTVSYKKKIQIPTLSIWQSGEDKGAALHEGNATKNNWRIPQILRLVTERSENR